MKSQYQVEITDGHKDRSIWIIAKDDEEVAIIIKRDYPDIKSYMIQRKGI